MSTMVTYIWNNLSMMVLSESELFLALEPIFPSTSLLFISGRVQLPIQIQSAHAQFCKAILKTKSLNMSLIHEKKNCRALLQTNAYTKLFKTSKRLQVVAPFWAWSLRSKSGTITSQLERTNTICRANDLRPFLPYSKAKIQTSWASHLEDGTKARTFWNSL